MRMQQQGITVLRMIILPKLQMGSAEFIEKYNAFEQSALPNTCVNAPYIGSKLQFPRWKTTHSGLLCLNSAMLKRGRNIIPGDAC